MLYIEDTGSQQDQTLQAPVRIKIMSEYKCPECGYSFNEDEGDLHEGYPPGTPFESLPADFACPDCSVRFKDDFVVI